MLRTATGSAPIKVHKADVADPERFKDLMNTLEREKVAREPLSYVIAIIADSHRASYPHLCKHLFVPNAGTD
jgi:hypothetical protein